MVSSLSIQLLTYGLILITGWVFGFEGLSCFVIILASVIFGVGNQVVDSQEYYLYRILREVELLNEKITSRGTSG